MAPPCQEEEEDLVDTAWGFPKVVAVGQRDEIDLQGVKPAGMRGAFGSCRELIDILMGWEHDWRATPHLSAVQHL